MSPNRSIGLVVVFAAMLASALRGQDGTAAAVPSAPPRLLAVDLTGDSLPEKVHLGAESVRVDLNLGGGRFSSARQELRIAGAHQLVVTDLDGDGVPDAYFLGAHGSQAWTGVGDGAFRAAPDLGLDDAGCGLSAERIDIDGDGTQDLLLHNVTGDVLFHARLISGRMMWRRDKDTPEISADDALAATPLSLAAALLGGLLDPGALSAGTEVHVSLDEHGRPALRLVAPDASAAGAAGDSSAASGGGPGSAPGTSKSAASVPAPVTLGGGTGAPVTTLLSPLPSLADLIERFVDDDEGEVDAADVADGSLLGAGV
jgi:hypothetical protein